METKEFYIAGFKHHEGMSIIDELGAWRLDVVLEPEPQNPYDPNAIKIYTPEGFMLGYVPRAIAKDLNLTRNYHAFISEINPSADPWLMVKVVVNF